MPFENHIQLRAQFFDVLVDFLKFRLLLAKWFEGFKDCVSLLLRTLYLGYKIEI